MGKTGRHQMLNEVKVGLVDSGPVACIKLGL